MIYRVWGIPTYLEYPRVRTYLSYDLARSCTILHCTKHICSSARKPTGCTALYHIENDTLWRNAVPKCPWTLSLLIPLHYMLTHIPRLRHAQTDIPTKIMMHIYIYIYTLLLLYINICIYTYLFTYELCTGPFVDTQADWHPYVCAHDHSCRLPYPALSPARLVLKGTPRGGRHEERKDNLIRRKTLT